MNCSSPSPVHLIRVALGFLEVQNAAQGETVSFLYQKVSNVCNSTSIYRSRM